MRTLYISCDMGAAGDMLTAALLELFDDREEVIKELNSLNIPDVRFEAETAVKCGITGSLMHVYVKNKEEAEMLENMHDHHHDHIHPHDHSHSHEHEHLDDHDHPHEHGRDLSHEHEHDSHHGHDHAELNGPVCENTGSGLLHVHNDMHSIGHIVRDQIKVSSKVRDDIMNVYRLIADAESAVHGKKAEEIHFHEVGTMDAVADITAVCYLLDKLKVDKILSSAIHVGKGSVKCAHGILPVPAPATALILNGVPIYSREDITGELCTPTGAALLKHFASSFVSMPRMSVEKIGYGMGKKDFEQANCVRVMLGDMADIQEQIIELSCNIDDMTGEELGFAMELLMEKGALDVFTVPIGMKKSRPGIMLHIVCKEKDKAEILHTIFAGTSTIGVRESVKNRYALSRRIETVKTSAGDVRIKYSSGYGVRKHKPEYEDIARIAKDKGCSVREAARMIEKEINGGLL